MEPNAGYDEDKVTTGSRQEAVRARERDWEGPEAVEDAPCIHLAIGQWHYTGCCYLLPKTAIYLLLSYLAADLKIQPCAIVHAPKS